MITYKLLVLFKICILLNTTLFLNTRQFGINNYHKSINTITVLFWNVSAVSLNESEPKLKTVKFYITFHDNYFT